MNEKYLLDEDDIIECICDLENENLVIENENLVIENENLVIENENLVMKLSNNYFAGQDRNRGGILYAGFDFYITDKGKRVLQIIN